MESTSKSHHLSSVFVQASRLISAVMDGRSLSTVLENQRQKILSEEYAAVQHLCYSVIREFGSLQGIIDALAKRPPTDPILVSLLACACSRLRSRPSVAYATIDQAVEAAKILKLPTGFVNGLLRNYLRRQTEIETFIRESTDPEIRWNLPAWWLYQLQNSYPDHWEKIVEASNMHPPMTLRVNRRKIETEAFLERLQTEHIEATKIGKTAIRLDVPMNVHQIPGFKEGEVSVQDAGAQEAARLLDPQDGHHVLDACCAPGGKTGHLLEWADISLVGIDIEKHRIDKVQQNLDRLNLDSSDVQLHAADCLDIESWFDGRAFDRILLDVPCSGSGVVRRHPEAKWLKQPSDIDTLLKTQQQMLDTLWSLLKPGGRMLYATCSVFGCENEEQVFEFVNRQPDAKWIPIEDKKCHQLLPTPDYDGFFYTLIEKRMD